MKINWVHNGEDVSKDVPSLLQYEYNFRKNITKILLKEMDEDTLDRLHDAHFNLHVKKRKIKVSSKTPEPLYSNLKRIVKNGL